jgi:hypothetical protein
MGQTAALRGARALRPRPHKRTHADGIRPPGLRDGMRVPMEGEVVWLLQEGPKATGAGASRA